uniref:Uncharacterized protein n=2 Tax=Meloidogyne TaxID=189290 RepID=A0A915NMH0_9BILA
MDIPKIVLITTIFTFLNTSAILAKSIAVIDNEPEFRDPNDGKRRLSMIVEDATAEREWGKSWTMIFNVVGIPLICIGACCLLYCGTKYFSNKWKKARNEARARKNSRTKSKSRDKSGENTKRGGSQRASSSGGTKSSFDIKKSDGFPKSICDVPQELDLMEVGAGGGTAASRWGTLSISSTTKSTTKSAATASRMVGGSKSTVNSATGATSLNAAKGVVTPDTISEESTSDREKSKEESSDENSKKKKGGGGGVVANSQYIAPGVQAGSIFM